jgi:hypothetical protein
MYLTVLRIWIYGGSSHVSQNYSIYFLFKQLCFKFYFDFFFLNNFVQTIVSSWLLWIIWPCTSSVMISDLLGRHPTMEEQNIYQKMTARMKKWASLKPLKFAKYSIASVKWWIGWKDRVTDHLHLLHLQNSEMWWKNYSSFCAKRKYQDYFKNTE